MTSQITPFCFGENLLRTLVEQGIAWFVAGDVCKALGLAKTDRATADLDSDEKGAHTVSTPGGMQKVTTVTESGLYSLIFKSRKEEAKSFRKWVTAEVLPQIRKTGSFSTASHAAEPTDIFLPSDRVLELIRRGLAADAAERLVLADLEFMKLQHASGAGNLEEVDQARMMARMENPMERAEALGELRAKGMTVAEIIDKVGSHHAMIYRHLAVLRLPAECKEALRNREISVNTGNAMLKLPVTKQREALKEIQKDKLPERAAMKLIEAKLNKTTRKAAPVDSILAAMQPGTDYRMEDLIEILPAGHPYLKVRTQRGRETKLGTHMKRLARRGKVIKVKERFATYRLKEPRKQAAKA